MKNRVRQGSFTSLLPVVQGFLCGATLLSPLLYGQVPVSAPSPLPPVASSSSSHTPKKVNGVDAEARFQITGRVINSLSKMPVGRADVTVSPMGVRRHSGRFAGRGGGQAAAATTDSEGRFALEVPSAGGWSLSVTAHGYHPQTFEEHGEYSTAIILTDAKPVHDILFQLTPASAIEGYVLDEAGEAVRNAQLTVNLIPPATPEDQHPKLQPRGNQRTDDRGYFKFSGLLSGDYVVRVQAQPWYATNGGSLGSGAPFSSAGVSANGSPDPLDVVYPVVWFPGVTDFAAATPITVRGGETKEADFRLSPVPGFHLRVPKEPQSGIEISGSIERSFSRNNASLIQVLPDGSEAGVPPSVRTDRNGVTEFSGLVPGTYLLRGADGNSAGTIRIAENSARTLDASQAVPAVPVEVKVEAAAEMGRLQISFRNTESGQVSYVQGQRGSGRREGRHGSGPAEITQGKANDAQERSINLQPGKYEVLLNGINDLHLTGIEAEGAVATGRTVTVSGGAPLLTLHVASGRAAVTGIVQFHGKTPEGAMVILVPATLGDPAGLGVTRRDQSNTDGSFDINAVLPGAYILVAIDHGWDVNWSEAATLRHFLMHGVPLDLSKGGERNVTVEAQSP